VTDDNRARRSEDELACAYGNAYIAKALENAIDDYAMFPDEATNSWVLGNGFIHSFFNLVSRFDRFYRDVVDERMCMVGDLILEDEGDIALKYLDSISVTLRKRGQSMRA
jgi:hypothetical protein